MYVAHFRHGAEDWLREPKPGESRLVFRWRFSHRRLCGGGRRDIRLNRCAYIKPAGDMQRQGDLIDVRDLDVGGG
ncbi:hypothetical protein AA23498_0956 [Acetobacter nitrogenifigens DSM 23921 = NBRC 105050]|nr:hypothetical protein AA23498_0956 [Acetobacter nitrogenifigens DSM 23921 = NBRC 105050]